MARSAVATKITLALPSNYHLFYYMWYGNVATDGSYRHWNNNSHVPGSDDIDSNYYPAQGIYSSNDPVLLAAHMAYIKRAGIQTIILSWWGQGSFEDLAVLKVMNAAAAAGIKCGFLIDAYSGRSIATVITDIAYIYAHYGSHPAFYTSTLTSTWGTHAVPKGVFYLYASDNFTLATWATQLDALRGTANDGIFLGNGALPPLASNETTAHMDGLFTYDILNNNGQGFAGIGAACASASLLWSPSIGPGYWDVRNGGTGFVSRENGFEYDRFWNYALNSQPTFVSITSFNEFHEGHMIEPSQVHTGGGFTYNNFENTYGTTGVPAQNSFLDRTNYWVSKQSRFPSLISRTAASARSAASPRSPA